MKHDPDSLKTCQGIMFGIVIGLMFWSVIITVVWKVLQ